MMRRRQRWVFCEKTIVVLCEPFQQFISFYYNILYHNLQSYLMHGLQLRLLQCSVIALPRVFHPQQNFSAMNKHLNTMASYIARYLIMSLSRRGSVANVFKRQIGFRQYTQMRRRTFLFKFLQLTAPVKRNSFVWSPRAALSCGLLWFESNSVVVIYLRSIL